jgi:hypothetical protein
MARCPNKVSRPVVCGSVAPRSWADPDDAAHVAPIDPARDLPAAQRRDVVAAAVARAGAEWGGAAASAAVQRYRALPEADREALLAFLASL